MGSETRIGSSNVDHSFIVDSYIRYLMEKACRFIILLKGRQLRLQSVCFKMAILICLCVTNAHAQHPFFHHFTKADGLISDNIYDVILDQNEDFWFCTDKGISQFDGINFRNYTTADGLPDDEILSLFKDSQNRIWFGSFGGVPGFYQNDTFHNPQNCRFLQGVKNRNYISAYAESPTGEIIVGSRDGNVHIVKENQPSRLLFQEVPSSMAAILFRKEIMEIVNSTCEVIEWDGISKGYCDLPPEHPPTFEEIMVVTSLNNQRILMGYGQKFSVIDSCNNRINSINSRLRSDGSFILKLKQVDGYGVFACTTKGAYLFESDDFSTTHLRRFLPDIHVSSVASDNDAGLWFTTNRGIFYLPEPQIDLGGNSKDQDNIGVSAILPTSTGKAIVAHTDGGVAIVDEKGARLGFRTTYGKDVLAKTSIISSIDSNLFWVGTDKYLGIGNQADGTIEPVIFGRVADFSVDPVGDSVCLCHSFGFELYNIRSIISQRLSGRHQIGSASQQEFRCLASCFDSSGTLWVATKNSILEICAQKIVNEYPTSSLTKGARITDLECDRQGNVFIATLGSGLFVLGPSLIERPTIIGAKLPNSINCIELVCDSLLGVGTDSGLFLIRLDYSKRVGYSNFGIGSLDGLPSDEITSFTYADSVLFVATPEGFCSFPLDMFHKELRAPRVNIRHVEINGKLISSNSTAVIGYTEQGIIIAFAGSCFRSMGHFDYKYQLDGLDSEWHYTENTQVEYPFLEPGGYVFRVYCANHKGNWSELPASFSFQVLTPFWKSIWFNVLSILLAILFVLAVFLLLINHERKKSKILGSLYDAEQRALIGQMNPHFIFNALNSVQKYYINNDIVRANEFLSKFGDLIRSTLDNSRTSLILLSDELIELRAYLSLEALRLRNRFDFSIEFTNNVNPTEIQLPTMLIQPFVENAIWHGITPLEERRGRIVLRFTLLGGMLKCEVEDNGIGRDKARSLNRLSKKGKSHAMDIVAERISLINRFNYKPIQLCIVDLFDYDGNPAGTNAILLFPL